MRCKLQKKNHKTNVRANKNHGEKKNKEQQKNKKKIEKQLFKSERKWNKKKQQNATERDERENIKKKVIFNNFNFLNKQKILPTRKLMPCTARTASWT